VFDASGSADVALLSTFSDWPRLGNDRYRHAPTQQDQELHVIRRIANCAMLDRSCARTPFIGATESRTVYSEQQRKEEQSVEKPFILHMFTPEKNLSPFDVNMALDAGWISAIPYLNIELGEVTALVQDAIFSRSPSGVKRTGIFIGGRDVKLAMDMLATARKAMVPPFVISVLADPSGAFTTAAAMVAMVERELEKRHQTSLQGRNVLALGGTGPVGQIAAVLSAKAGANVKIVGRQLERSQRIAELCNAEFGNGETHIQGDADANKPELMKTADVVFATAAAGIEVLNAELVASAPQLKVAADVNAVPPSGIAGLGPHHAGTEIEGSRSGAVGVGALAIGNIKYQTQHRLLNLMRFQLRQSDKPVFLDYNDAFEVAREYVKKL
jgi:methylene-tetrahydromethanopterin dehydrogenase